MLIAQAARGGKVGWDFKLRGWEKGRQSLSAQLAWDKNAGRRSWRCHSGVAVQDLDSMRSEVEQLLSSLPLGTVHCV